MIWEKRADAISALGAAFVVGWISCSGYYSITHLWQKQNQLVAQVGCEDARADKTARIAKQAIVSAQSDNVPIPSPSAIPKDCPHSVPLAQTPVPAKR